MRLIDADKLIKVIRNNIPLGEWMNRSIPKAMSAMSRLVEEVDKQPTVNEWHYPSKGDYPTDDRRVLCKLKGVEDWYECGGYDKDDDTWGFESFNTVGDDVVAWQYIEPPKEIEKNSK